MLSVIKKKRPDCDNILENLETWMLTQSEIQNEPQFKTDLIHFQNAQNNLDHIQFICIKKLESLMTKFELNILEN
jgi:hypothetical protein